MPLLQNKILSGLPSPWQTVLALLLFLSMYAPALAEEEERPQSFLDWQSLAHEADLLEQKKRIAQLRADIAVLEKKEAQSEGTLQSRSLIVSLVEEALRKEREGRAVRKEDAPFPLLYAITGRRTLRAHFRGHDGERMVVSVGDRVDGWRVVSVSRSKVVLRKNTETRSLFLGD